MFIVDKRKNDMLSLPAREIKAAEARTISSELAVKILRLLAQKPMYPIEVAKALSVNEQKVYYHIRNLEKSGIVGVVREEERQGATAKYYAMDKPALVVRFREMEQSRKLVQLKGDAAFLEPFVQDGELKALIIVGSPDPHGPEKARSRDGYYGMDLALFLGTFLNYVPELAVKLDTEVREHDLQNSNLILIGGPVVNRVTGEVNGKLPVRFDREEHWSVRSTASGNTYPTDESGIIVKTKSPFNPEKQVLVVAGKRHVGTRAAIIGFLKHFNEICAGNVYNRKLMAKVVEGVDLDSDGIIDEVELRE